MKKKVISLTLLISLLIILSCTIFYIKAKNDNLSQTQAISLIKSSYLEFKDYPSDSLPPQSIKTEKVANGWYIAFIQEGSGIPLIEARCFFIKNDASIADLGKFKPNSLEDFNFSIRTCK